MKMKKMICFLTKNKKLIWLKIAENTIEKKKSALPVVQGNKQSLASKLVNMFAKV